MKKENLAKMAIVSVSLALLAAIIIAVLLQIAPQQQTAINYTFAIFLFFVVVSYIFRHLSIKNT